ncbi:retrieval of early ER protein Rer1 [Chytriomyces cf. hyalinus JEL632]|nr:retrieval of early ER protein Rer1 [Chytriomyces cf. hyalinus JEL632]
MDTGTGQVDPPKGLPNAVKQIERRIQQFLDQTTPYHKERWAATALLFVLYFVRVWFIAAFYIVTYSLGIYLLNLFLAFLQPKFDPAMEADNEDDEMALPVKADDDFKPFIRRLPEFKFWYWATRGIVTAFVCTFIPLFDVPVFWPILVIYFLILFGLTMKQRIKHMIKYKYVPWTIKPDYTNGNGSAK